MVFKKTYKIVKDAPKGLTWDEYEKILKNEWNSLLNSNDKLIEQDFQEFFEKHPCMLPRPYNVFHLGGHDSIVGGLISQPKLPGFKTKFPDFLWLVCDSANVTAVFIEIKKPSDKWWNKDYTFKSELNKAVQQIRDYQVWFTEEPNMLTFKKFYNITDSEYDKLGFHQTYILIYGRREEAMSAPNSGKMRTTSQNSKEVFMSYDRLYPDSSLQNFFTAKIDGESANAKLKMINIPPTFEIDPFTAKDISRVNNREIAIKDNKYISKEEQVLFLVEI